MSRYTLLALLLIAVLAISGCGQKETSANPRSNPARFQTVNVQTAYNAVSSGNAIIVDVRNPEEWAALGYPAGAVLIPLPEFNQRAPNELPKDKDIYVICNSGNRSQVASQSLVTMGYPRVFNVDGGIQAWLNARLPVSPYTP